MFRATHGSCVFVGATGADHVYAELQQKENVAMSKKTKKSAKPKAKVEGDELKPAAPNALSGLGAAAKVLADAGEPLNAKQIVERIVQQGLWQSGGKTPHATIYAAMIREIAAKGAEARFSKAERGKFTIAS